jgi:YbbR domain-containing protein
MIIKFLGSNSGFKIISLIMAIILWFFMAMRGQTEISLVIPMEFKNIPAEYEITSQTAKTVNVTLKGQESLIKKIMPHDVNLFIPLDNAKEGETIYYLNKDNLIIPSEINVKLINPTYVKITIEKTISRYIKIQPVIIGKPLEGYRLKGVISNPAQILIKGTKDMLDSIQYIKTEPIDINNHKSRFTCDIPLTYEGINTKNPVDKIQVTVIIEKNKQTK